MEKAVLFLLGLKSLSFRSNGYIHNYRSRYVEIAKALNCSDATVRRRINELKRLKLVQCHGKNLSLRSYSTLCSLYGVAHARRHLVNLSTYLLNPRFILESIALDSNIAQQQYVITKKVNNVLSDNGRRTKKTRRIAKVKEQEFHKSNGISLLDAIEQLNFNVRTENSFSDITSSTHLINDIKSKSALSCIGMAKMIGRRSAITGSKRLRKMVSLGIIERKYRYEVIYNGADARQALSYFRSECTNKHLFVKGHFVLSPIACSISMSMALSSCKVSTLFERK